jgi:hypothetical protein
MKSGKREKTILHSLAAIAAAVVVAACSSMSARTAAEYDRGSAPEAQLQKDAASCEKEAELHQKEFGYGQYDPTRGPYNRLYDACMQSHGYQRKPQP